MFTWLLPAAAAVSAVALAYTRFLLALPRRTSRLFVLSGAMYLGGSMGMEIVGARHISLWGLDNLVFVAIVTIEETLEMGGIALFLLAVVKYAASDIGVIRVRFHSS